MRARGSKALAALVIAAAVMTGGQARADAASEKAAAAEELFRQARDLAAADKFAEACPKFAASQKLDPGYGTLWNLADCQQKLGQTASAWASFREAADMAKKAGQAERESKATRRADELEPSLERMIINASPAEKGLTIKRGDVELDASTWGTPLPVDPGKHVITGSAPGKKTFTIEGATKGPGTTVTIEIPPLVDDATAGPAPARSGSTQRIAGIAVGSAGVVGVVIGAVFGLSAKSKWNDAQSNHCRTDSLCDDTGVSLVSDAKSAATISTVGFIVGSAAVAAGVVLVITAPKGAPPRDAGLVLAPGFGSLTARGTF